MGILFLLPLQLRAAFCKNVLAYYNSSSKPAYNATRIPFTKISHLCHAFVTLNADGSLQIPAGFVEATLIPSAHAANTKVLLSVGGAGGSALFATVASNNTLRWNFAAAVKNFVFNNNYDGADIDWEFPQNAADRANFSLLITALRSTFDGAPNAHPEWLISSAVSNDPWTLQWMDLATLNGSLNFFNLMTYDYHGPWSTHSGDNGPLNPSGGDPHGGAYSAADSVNYLLGQGVSASKINLGLAFYGYQFPVANLNQNCAASNCLAAFALKYSEIAPLVGAGWTRQWDTLGASPWLNRNAGGQMIAYDDSQSVQAKANWAFNTKNLGGVFCWSLDQDYLGPGNQPLVDAMSAPLNCSTASATVTSTLTRTTTQTMTRSPTLSASPSLSSTLTPSPTATLSKSSSFTPNLTFTVTQSITATHSKTASPSVSMTFSATFIPPSISPSQTRSATTSRTATPSLSATLSLTVPISATCSATLSSTTTQTHRSEVTGGVFEIEALVPFPNPGTKDLLLKLSAPADLVELKIYSCSHTLVAVVPLAAVPSGWQHVPIQSALGNGLYFASATAKRGSEACKLSKICKFLILK